jgi:hypothetical protein
MPNNNTANIIQTQLATRSGQIAINNNGGSYSYVDTLTGKTIPSSNITNSLLANPQRPNDPKLTAQTVDIARGFFSGTNTPPEMIEAIASVASYVSNTSGIPVQHLFKAGKISLQLIQAYNAFKPKSSQIGIFVGSGNPAWINNPTLRGSIASAIVYQP